MHVSGRRGQGRSLMHIGRIRDGAQGMVAVAIAEAAGER
jgi:hypothetical protein